VERDAFPCRKRKKVRKRKTLSISSKESHPKQENRTSLSQESITSSSLGGREELPCRRRKPTNRREEATRWGEKQPRHSNLASLERKGTLLKRGATSKKRKGKGKTTAPCPRKPGPQPGQSTAREKNPGRPFQPGDKRGPSPFLDGGKSL